MTDSPITRDFACSAKAVHVMPFAEPKKRSNVIFASVESCAADSSLNAKLILSFFYNSATAISYSVCVNLRALLALWCSTSHVCVCVCVCAADFLVFYCCYFGAEIAALLQMMIS